MLFETIGGRFDPGWEQETQRDHQAHLSGSNEPENPNDCQDVRHEISSPLPAS